MTEVRIQQLAFGLGWCDSMSIMTYPLHYGAVYASQFIIFCMSNLCESSERALT